ncbi:MAG TPA: hypothetical protein VEI94_07755 [Candidatus Bathyarchaeia archaeon]|nr:hypothetical protein [Candidatus Bathyarchaeia archaeon]
MDASSKFYKTQPPHLGQQSRRVATLRDMVRTRHQISCPYCREEFDLFVAPWCGDQPEPSKICPSCGRCLCKHPAYTQPAFWKQAPAAFERYGFRRLFLLYL